MRGGVDATGQSGHHREPRVGQIAGHGFRHPQPQRRGISRAHQPNHRAAKGGRLPHDPQDGRGIGDIHQGFGIFRQAKTDHARAAFAGELHFCARHVFRADTIAGHPGLFRDVRKRL